MRLPRLLLGCLAGLCALVILPAALAQSKAPPTSAFAPFVQWQSAVRSGRPQAIAAFYSSAPPPTLVVSTGVFTDVQREANFWATWKKQGLTQLQIDLITDQPVTDQLHQIGFEAGLHYQGVAGPQSLFLFVQQTWLLQSGHWVIVSGGRSDLSRLQ